MASLLIVTGPPGAGKSTVSAILAARATRSVLVEGDRFFDFLARGAVAPWLPDALAQNEIVAEAAARSTGRFGMDYDTIFDGVVIPGFLPRFAAATGLVELDYVVLRPSVEVCVARVRSRIGHGFDDEASTRRMHAEFTTSATDPRHVVEPGSVDATAVAEAVVSAPAAGRLRYTADQREPDPQVRGASQHRPIEL